MQVEKQSEESDLKSARLGLPVLSLDGEEEWGELPSQHSPCSRSRPKIIFLVAFKFRYTIGKKVVG